ncbi:MAG: (p)ppGpp synthetase [candidate division Zixibacteria bacterium]|nr:(p)ppGpp synthetase [candidate division Zixibacteria bacterium]
MSKKKETDLVKFKEDYQKLKLTFENFLVSMKTEIEKILSDSEINLAFPIQLRTKTWDSIIDKIDRVPISLKRITDMQDLCGMRIVLLFVRDADTVINRINEQLKITKLYDTGERLENNQFGYTSTHIIAEIPDEWLKVPSLSDFKNLKVEIQVRTISQHLWSEASNLLQYKKEQSVPNEVLRSVSRVSALLETVDLEFERVLDEREEYISEVKKSIKKIDDIELNVDLLEQILDDNLPIENKGTDESYAEMIKNLQLVNVSTKKALIDFIRRNKSHALEEEKISVEKHTENLKNNQPLAGTTKERILKGVFYKHIGFVRNMITNEAGKSWGKIKVK